MLAKLTNIRPFAIRATRAIGVAGIAAAAFGIAPAALASADDEALPGAPIVRSSDPGVPNAGPSEVRGLQSYGNGSAYSPGVSQNANGGGTIKDGNMFTPGRVGHGTLCGTKAYGGYGKALSIIDCGSDFIPYN